MVKKLQEMAISQNKAIDKCQELGIKFIEHFEKIYDNPNSEAVHHWEVEMSSWLNKVKSYTLKSTNKKLTRQNLDEWFYTACGEPYEYFKNSTEEKIEAYDEFYHLLDNNYTIHSAIISVLKEE